MALNLEFGTLADAEEAQHLGTILQQCFNFKISKWRPASSLLGLENYRVIRHNGQIIGGLGIYYMGQWFGGCSLPMAGIAALGIAPQCRGIGAATKLITSTLHELYARGIPLSTLYASTQRLYQKVGYEQAGNACQFSIPTSSLIASTHLPIHQVDPACQEVFQDLYCQRAKRTNGNLDRNSAIWKRVLQPPEDSVYAYLLGQHKPEGYIVFSQQSDPRGYNLKVKDLVILTPAAGRSMWNFFANHRSLANDILWVGPAVEPLLTFLPEQTYKVSRLQRWFLRIINVPKALMLRGYPLGVETELHLEVKDHLLPQNNGRFILTVSQGCAEVTQGGRGELRLDVRALAPLYTSLFTPHQLQALGQIEATNVTLSTAAQLFGGSEPWMPDHF